MHSSVPLLLLLLLCTAAAAAAASDGSRTHSQAQAQAPGAAAAARRGMVPVAPADAELGAMALLALNDTRRRLGGSFQLCAPCTCCGGASGACLLSPCCYSINCNIPNRPFGYCSFAPKSCGCIGCSL